MAKAALNFPFSGSLGCYSCYSMRGVNKLILRSKGGPSKEQIASGKQFETTRKNMSEFGGCGMAGGKIGLAVDHLKEVADYNFTGKLNSICKVMQTMELENLGVQGHLGKTPVLISKYGKILDGFNVNQNNPFDTIVNNSPTFDIVRNELKATLQFPDLIPGINFVNAWNLLYYRFKIQLGMVPDMVFYETKYAPATPALKLTSNNYMMDWISCSDVNKGNSVEIKLPNSVQMDDSISLILSISVQFGKLRPGSSLIEKVKFVGCGKILAVR